MSHNEDQYESGKQINVGKEKSVVSQGTDEQCPDRSNNFFQKKIGKEERLEVASGQK